MWINQTIFWFKIALTPILITIILNIHILSLYSDAMECDFNRLTQHRHSKLTLDITRRSGT